MTTIAVNAQGASVDIEELARTYRRVFGCPAGAQVLLDLAPKCFAGTSTYATDPRDHARNEGMREVWLHINTFLNYTPAQVARIYRNIPILLTDEEEFA